MLGLCYSRLQLVAVRCRISCVDSVNHSHCFQKGLHFTSSFSSKSLVLETAQTHDKYLSFTASYLIDSLGFPPELAQKQRDLFKSPEKPDSVVKLLKDYGLSGAQISQIAKRNLVMFTLDAENVLLPKLEFLSSIGISGTALARMLCTLPAILNSSLEGALKPCYEISITLSIPKEKLPLFFITYRRSLNAQKLANVARNVLVLRAYHVPESSITLWVAYHAQALSFDSEKVKENVKKVISMGFFPSSPTFMRALYVISVTDESKWKRKMKFYRKWGWTEDDVMLAFSKSPLFMAMSEKNFSSKFGFFARKMGWQPAYVAETPSIFNYSLEKSIIPRCSVIRYLEFKGFIKEGEHSLSAMLTVGNKGFLDRFVFKYQKQAPELLSIFQGEIALAELGLGFEKRGKVKQK